MMNRGLNLPSIQRIMMEFEKEGAMMDMKEEMMSDAIDDVMDDEVEDEEEEGDKILKEVLDEIGVNLSQQVGIGLMVCYTLYSAKFLLHRSLWTLQQEHSMPHSRISDKRWLLERVMVPC